MLYRVSRVTRARSQALLAQRTTINEERSAPGFFWRTFCWTESSCRRRRRWRSNKIVKIAFGTWRGPETTRRLLPGQTRWCYTTLARRRLYIVILSLAARCISLCCFTTEVFSFSSSSSSPFRFIIRVYGFYYPVIEFNGRDDDTLFLLSTNPGANEKKLPYINIFNRTAVTRFYTNVWCFNRGGRLILCTKRSVGRSVIKQFWKPTASVRIIRIKSVFVSGRVSLLKRTTYHT